MIGPGVRDRVAAGASGDHADPLEISSSPESPARQRPGAAEAAAEACSGHTPAVQGTPAAA